MAEGDLIRLFLDPESRCLEGFYMQAHVSAHRLGRLYAALYFKRIWQPVADEIYHEVWECAGCVCHISLAADDELPDFNLGTTQRLHKALGDWKFSHSSVEVTLHYTECAKPLLPEDRFVLNIIPEEESSLFRLLKQLRTILVGHDNPPQHGYHVSVTNAGEVKWRKEIPGGSPPDQPEQPSPGDATSSGTVSFASEGHANQGRPNINPENPWR